MTIKIAGRLKIGNSLLVTLHIGKHRHPLLLSQTQQAFTQFRIRYETERLCPHQNLLDTVDWSLFT